MREIIASYYHYFDDVIVDHANIVSVPIVISVEFT